MTRRWDGKESENQPLWLTPERLFGAHWVRTAECEDRERPPGITGNPSHVLLGTEEMLHRDANRSLDFAGEVLGISAEGPWRWQRPYLSSLLRLFCDESSDAPAWLTIIPMRMPHELRFAGKDLVPKQRANPAVPISDQLRLNHIKLDLGFGIGTLDTTSLLMEYSKIDSKSRPFLIRQERYRTLEGSDFGVSVDSLIYLADFGCDRDMIAKGHVPAISQYLDPVLNMQTTASITFAKLGRSVGCEVTQVIVTMQPEDGRTVAIVPGRRSLMTYCHQYPIDETLLTRGASQ